MQLATKLLKIAAGIALMLQITMAAPVVTAIERAVEEAPIWSPADSLVTREQKIPASQLASAPEVLDRRTCGYTNGHYACPPLGGHPRDVDAEIMTRSSKKGGNEENGIPGGTHTWSAHYGSPESGLRRSEGSNDHDTAFWSRDRNELDERSVESDIPKCHYDVFGVLRCD